MGRSLFDIAPVFTVWVSGLWNQRGPVGESVTWSPFQQQLGSLWLRAPCNCSSGPGSGIPCQDFHAAVGLQCQEWGWTEQYLLCSAALPPAEGQIFGGRKGLEITSCLFAWGGSEVSAWPRCMGCNSSFDVAHLSCFQSNKLSTAEK